MNSKRRKSKVHHEFEVDLKPMINLLVVLIPFLLMCAEFSKITLVEINLPGRMDESAAAAVRTDEEGLNLTVIITDYTMTIGAKGGFLPYTNYREFHQYASKTDKATFTVEYNPKKANVPVHSPTDNKKMTPQERNVIDLFACVRENPQDSGVIMYAYYNKLGQALTNENGQFLNRLNIGDRVYPLPLRRTEVVKSISDYKLKPLSAYDKLTTDLLTIRAKYSGLGMPDENDIIIAAEDRVAYDKIIQIIDKCKSTGFLNVSIAKMRG